MKTKSGTSAVSGVKLRPNSRSVDDGRNEEIGSRSSRGVGISSSPEGVGLSQNNRSHFQPTGSSFVSEHVEEPPSRVVIDDGEPTGGVHQRQHEATLPHDKGRVCSRTWTLPDSRLHQDDDSAGGAGDGSGEPPPSGVDPGSQGSQRHHGEHQEGQTRRTSGDVSCPKYQHHRAGPREDYGGRNEDSPSHVGAQSGHIRDKDRVRHTSWPDLRGSGEVSIPSTRCGPGRRCIRAKRAAGVCVSL